MKIIIKNERTVYKKNIYIKNHYIYLDEKDLTLKNNLYHIYLIHHTELKL